MLFSVNDASLEGGFCWGEFEITVDTGPRIRLPRSVIQTLNSHKVKELWRFPDPTGPRMIICPGQKRQAYIEVAKQNFPTQLEAGEAYRRFICTGTQVILRDHGKVSITAACNRSLKVEAGEQVSLVGVGPWYELWRGDDWFVSCASAKI
jgi:DNA-binding transcriptional regulator/RsmH inhibitor MraZ